MKRTFKQTCEAAKADETLRQLVAAIRAANKAGTPDRTAYAALRDRFQELGLTLPNRAYWSFLMMAF